MYVHPFVEFLVRSAYFGLKLNKISIGKSRKKEVNKINLYHIENALKEYNIKKGDTIIVHSSFKFFSDKPSEVINFLKDYIGSSGNILMPTHPYLEKKDGYFIYDVQNSPSTVGVLTETFRKSEGVLRSEHPFSSIAVWGKDAEVLLEDNINYDIPLPHGVHSPYYKMLNLNAKVLCIGVNAIKRGTIRHVAEEVLDSNYRVKDLYNHYLVEVKNGDYKKKYEVRALNINKSQIFIAKSKIEKEWLQNGVLKKKRINDIPIDYIDAKKCVDYMISEAEKGNTCYPFASKRW